MLTDEERQKIYEEERLRQELRGPSPTDILSSCILAPIIIVGLVIGIGILVVIGLCIKGVVAPVFH